MDDVTRRLLKDKKFVKLMRNLCPSGESSCSSITISKGDQSVTLTPETRKVLNDKLKRMK